MLLLTVSLTVTLLTLQARVDSWAPLPEIRLPASPSQISAQELAQLQAQAAGGSVTAELKLARAYESGLGVPQDDRLAAQWYRKAAERGNSEAQDALGAMYLVGQGLEQNKDEAARWFQKSACQGNASAMYRMGAAYYNGDGVPINDSLAYAWFKLAEAAGNQRATDAVQRAESELKPTTVTNGLKRIAELFEPNGCLPQNESQAAHWWSMAAARGDPDAQVALAMKLLTGQGLPQDLVQGRQLCNEAAKNEQHRGQYCMGYIYQRGLGVTPDPKKAREWYARAARGGNVPATKALAAMEAAGEGGKADRVNAFLLYATLVQAHDQEALRSLARLKKSITPKEWAQLQKPLKQLRIDPAKLDTALQQIDTK
jgi:hypothetical protein